MFMDIAWMTQKMGPSLDTFDWLIFFLFRWKEMAVKYGQIEWAWE